MGCTKSAPLWGQPGERLGKAYWQRGEGWPPLVLAAASQVIAEDETGYVLRAVEASEGVVAREVELGLIDAATSQQGSATVGDEMRAYSPDGKLVASHRARFAASRSVCRHVRCMQYCAPASHCHSLDRKCSGSQHTKQVSGTLLRGPQNRLP